MSSAVHFDFPEPPPMLTVLIRKRAFKLIDISPYERKDGTNTFLLHWETRCAKCSDAYVHKTGLRGNLSSKTCPAHRPQTLPYQFSVKRDIA